MEIKSTEFFRNMKTLPPPGTEEFRQLIKWEEEKILGGVNINGVHISGWLYWHLNHWWIRIDDVDEYGNDVRKECNPELRDNEWIRAEALEKAKNERKGYIEIGGRQGGKELADYEPVITENGLKPIGKIIPGDKIFSENGKLCTVTHVFPQGIKPIYRMYLADGRYVDSGLNHKWEVFDSANRRLIKTTEELIKGKISFPHKRSGTTYKYSIKETEEVQFSKKELPIPPYVLGALLGDGCTTGGTNNINVADLEIVEKLKKLLPEYDLNEDFFKKENGEISKLRYNIVYKGAKKFMFNKNPLNQELIKLNLKCKAPYKFIPEIYKYSSVEDRYELIRGILDTDGSINSKGSIELKLSSKQLIDDVAWVLRSLGIQCRISILDKRGTPQNLPGNRIVYTEHVYYRLYIRTDKPIFNLERKLNRVKKRTKKNKTSIVKIEYLCDHSATCITVDNPSHLFLTKDFIVTHNSEMEASYFGMNAIMFQNTQNVIVCGNDNDLSLLKDKVDFGLRKLWKGLAIPRLDKTWRSNQVRLGYKTPDGDDKIWSYIIIRNAKDGHNTEVAAGTTAKSFIMDEVGKYSFSSAFKAAEPAFKGKNGWRAVPILVGTGGSFDNGKDAENFFYNPEANNFLTIENEDNSKTGLFLSGLYRQDCKYKTTLADYLINVRGMNLPDVSELSQIEMWVSDKEKALKTIEKERVAAKLHPDRTMYLKQVMYFPITVNECFLSASQNIFDVESAKHQKARLLAQEKTGTPVVLYNDGEKITHRFTDKLPITNFPLKTDDSKDAPVVIYEFPIESPPYGLYVAGCLLPGEKVSTEKGLMNVEDVTLDNKLVNIEGELVNIHNLQRYLKKNEDVYSLRLSNNARKTIFTKEHPIYVSDEFYTYFDGKNKSLDETKFKFDFVEIKDVKKGQWVKTPNRFVEKNNLDIGILWSNIGHRIDRHIKSPLYSSEFWWFIGLFLGDGWVDSKKNKITVSCNIKEEEIIDRLYKLINELFNRSASKRIRNNCVEVSFSCKQLSYFLSTHFKKYALGKSIPDWAKKIDLDSKQQLIQGYLDSDGCITYDKKRNLYGLDFVSINLTLLEDIQDILFSLGHVSGINVLRKESVHNILGKTSKTKEAYQLRVGHHHTISFLKEIISTTSYKMKKVDLNKTSKNQKRNRKGCFISNDKKYIYFQIKDIEKSSYSGWVYNFECDTHTYMCKNIPTHNCDPYRQGQSKYSDSLGSVYIYKRMHDLTGEKYQDMFVASYCARPEKKEIWDEQARLLIKYYNARALVENDEVSFIDYMIAKGDAHYLEKQPDWLKEVVPNTTVRRDYGIHRSAEKIRDFLHTCLKKYLEEPIFVEKDENGNTIREILGVTKIFDPVLLEEIIQYNDDDNFDRVIAAELAIAQAMKMDPIFGKISSTKDSRVESLLKPKKRNVLFDNSKGLFTNNKNKLFR